MQSISVARLRAEILESSKEVALSWLPATRRSAALLAIELVLVLTAVRLRRRAIVRSGLGFVDDRARLRVRAHRP